MTDQNTPEGNDTTPGDGTPEVTSWSALPPTPAETPVDQQQNYTQPLPPFQQPAPLATTTAPVRRAGGLTATVLVGALLLGGGAGVGGAAWYDAWKNDDGTTSASSSGSGAIKATNAAAGPSGSVEKVASSVLPSVVKINVTGGSGTGSGSGIVLKADGTILTNNHVVSLAGDNGTITVNFNNGKTVKATVVGTDPVTDMAVIKAEGVSDLTPATIGKSSDLQVGQSVVAVGSPYGLNATVTTGIVSALNRPVSVQAENETPSNPLQQFGFGEQQQQQQAPANNSTTYPAIQTDAAINPGNSGGPLVDMNGRVVGVNSSIRTADSSSLSGSGGSIGLGFAIPIDEVLPIVNQIVDGETPTHARLAVTVSDVTAKTLAQGAQVQSVQSGGAADKAGLKKGDVITKVDEDLIDGSESLIATIRGHRPDDKVTLTYLRGTETRTTTATLGSDAESDNS
ncbi:PDZ domain-containing protein [Nocardioides marmoriginsengisoli]|uniref:PDZ domain-containing protein n=1 Tax=Nocardioides marmoriginsengisoli TaxID=661483 RepID=A0A3N0CAN5_9ACTN|nr:trypsin-like peptidase domain-containing protein [Nocardioides marmoriginsengisoli]RNL60525.1 PDZ domain-containing protein [Nocardioides marmoriginsengisoli]